MNKKILLLLLCVSQNIRAMENGTRQERPRPVRFQLLGRTDREPLVFQTAIGADDLQNQAQGILPYGIPGAPVDNQDRAHLFARLFQRTEHRNPDTTETASIKK